MSLYMHVCRWVDGGGEQGPHANNGMNTMHHIAVLHAALCLTLFLAGVPLLVPLCIYRNTLLFSFLMNG